MSPWLRSSIVSAALIGPLTYGIGLATAHSALAVQASVLTWVTTTAFALMTVSILTGICSLRESKLSLLWTIPMALCLIVGVALAVFRPIA